MGLTKNTKIILLALLVFALIIFGIYWNNKKHMPKYSWMQNYVYTNDQPYGTKILYTLLESYSDNKLELIEKENLRSFLNDRDAISPATYFVIGNHCNYQFDDIIALKKFARKGNTVFIALDELPVDFLKEISDNCIYEWYNYTDYSGLNISTNFVDSTLKSKQPYKYYYAYNDEKYNENWSYFSPNFCEDSIRKQVLGTLRPYQANFIKIKLGKGEVILHSNPIFFTNLHLIRPEAANYTEKVLSYLPEGPIYWDRNSKLWSITNSYDSNSDQSPFSYILQQRSFKWAFYVLWGAILLFLVFNLWRKQREIPVQFPKTNSTLEFIHTIGELYFSQKDNQKLAVQKMELFVKSVRTKHYITEKDENKFIELLTKKSGVEITHIHAIFNKYKHIKNSIESVSDETLIAFYKTIESFNKKSK